MIRTLISEKFGKEIDDNDTLADLGADPLDCVELLIDIDERLGVDLPDDAIGMETTVGEVVELVEGVTRSSAGRSAAPSGLSQSSLSQAEPAAANAKNCFGIPSEYRGWRISQECDDNFYGTGPNYDASYEGPEDGWVDNGERCIGCTWEDLRDEIDTYIEEHSA